MRESIDMSAEDMFALVNLIPQNDSRLPHPFVFENLNTAMRHVKSTWRFLWDYRNTANHSLYNDWIDAYRALSSDGNFGTILTSEDGAEAIRAQLGSCRAPVVEMRPKPLPSAPFFLDAFDDDAIDGPPIDYYDVIENNVMPAYQSTAEELGFLDGFDHELRDASLDETYVEALCDAIESEFGDGLTYDRDVYRAQEHLEYDRANQLDSFLKGIGVNSLLSELAILFDRGNVTIIPYHSYSLHNLEVPREDTVLVRPGRQSAQHWRTFQNDIRKLEQLLQYDAREHDIEMLLRSNPLFLRGLNYKKVYAQIVLPLGNGKSLRPDFIAEPCHSEWCDIIDLKVGSQKIYVGRDNRRSLANAIHQVSAQLREYSHYFAQDELAKVIEDKYGFKCHNPKLVAIIGRDPAGMGEQETRRAMTAYPNLEIVTYDQLLRAARSYLLL